MKSAHSFQVAAAICLSSCAALAAPLNSTDAPTSLHQAVLNYDPTLGWTSLYSPKPLASFLLTSTSGVLIPQNLTDLGPFDEKTNKNILKSSTEGFMEINYGFILPSGLSSFDILSDITASGELFNGGRVEDLPGGIGFYVGGTGLSAVEEGVAAGILTREEARFWLVSESFLVVGDVNFDFFFNSDDLILVFSAGEYSDEIEGNSTYVEGDWNFDQDFNSDDLIEAFSHGNYDTGPRFVPEPNSISLGLVAVAFLAARRTRVIK